MTPVSAGSGVFMAGSDGKGTIRQMAGFAMNKAPGSGGKAAFKTERLLGALTVTERDDIFIVSRLGKTVEITNTDAEGRLVLGDVLAWAAKTLQPAAMVDVATLTGACVVALGHWTAGLFGPDGKTVEAMLAAARAALAGAGGPTPKQGRAQRLTNDAEYNMQFVALGKGVHNVFYAADLLKLSNGWLDEALPLLGKPPLKTDDALVRGGYCAVLCHSTAGVRQPEIVTYGKQRIPHVRHVTEFGAVCTACHSAGVTAVIDRRLPRFNTCIVARAGASRISASDSRRVLRTSFTSTCTQRGASRVDLAS